MERDIKTFSQGQYDVLIVGGGINGAAVANLASAKGLKVALLDKQDFAGGTSSKSTKLIHGGLRYLENFELGLVYESLKERSIQLKCAPHLVSPLKFIIPVYKGDKRPFWMIKFGVWLYDFLSRKYMLERHQVLSVEDICHMIPGVERKGLLGGVSYSDAQMDDARLCLENVLSADQQGADVANYVEVRSFIQENGKAVGVKALDLIDKQTMEIRAKKIVCAVGPWTDIFMKRENSQSPPQLRPTKGVHLVYKGQISKDAILIPARRDQRIFFIIPWMENSLIGTTDTDFRGHPDNVEVEQEDIDYLFEETKRVLPYAELSENDIIASFAGLRPLIREHGFPSKVSRKHVIKTTYSGIIYVLGGKYTIYRKMAEEVVNKLVKSPINTQKTFQVYGSGDIDIYPETIALKYDVNLETVQLLLDTYGSHYVDLLEMMNRDHDFQKPICTCTPTVRAQVAYAIDVEMARTVEDVLLRRLSVGYYECSSGHCEQVVEDMLSERGFCKKDD